MITIIDYGAGNLQSVKNALDSMGIESEIVNTPEKVMTAKKIILPGVGSFGYMMDNLRKARLEKPILDAINTGVPFFGICLGLQALFEESEESKGVKGFGIFKGKVVRFKKGKVPQIGWNEILPRENSFIKRGYAYFVNSYFVVPKDKSIVGATTRYGVEFTSAIAYQNIVATQFHPEKSGDYGLELLKRWSGC
jgi:imidazole glycerol phosphate synthase glutamine amidotransferase subunit